MADKPGSSGISSIIWSALPSEDEWPSSIGSKSSSSCKVSEYSILYLPFEIADADSKMYLEFLIRDYFSASFLKWDETGLKLH